MQRRAIIMDLQEKAFAFARHLHDEKRSFCKWFP